MIPLITEGGNHPPSAYADACARTIFSIDPDMVLPRAVLAQELQHQITGALIPHFAHVIAGEAENLANFVDHCDTGLTRVLPIAEVVLQELQALAVGTPWENKLAAAEWATAALNTIASHLATAIHAERLWFADHHPDNVSAVAYRTRSNGA